MTSSSSTAAAEACATGHRSTRCSQAVRKSRSDARVRQPLRRRRLKAQPHQLRRHVLYYSAAMPYKFRAILETDANKIVIAGIFSDDDVTTLQRFLESYEQLATSRPMTQGIPCDISIKVADGWADVTSTLPTQDDLDIMFNRFRMFLHEKERAYFNRVCGILKRQVRSTPLLSVMKDQQRLFRNSPECVSTRVIMNGVVVSDEARLNDWIYGYQYHGHDERRAVFESAGIDVNHPAVRRAFVSLLLNKRDAIVNLAVLVAVLMRRHPQVAVADGTFRGLAFDKFVA